MCFIFASFGFHNSSYDLGSKGPAVKSVIVCLHKRRLLGYGRRFTCEARKHFVSPVYLQWEISSWQICSTVVSQVYSVRVNTGRIYLFMYLIKEGRRGVRLQFSKQHGSSLTVPLTE